MIINRKVIGHLPYRGISPMAFFEKSLPFLVAVLLALVLAWSSSAALEWFLSVRNFAAGDTLLSEGNRGVSRTASSVPEGPSIKDFVGANPFNVAIRPSSPGQVTQKKDQEQEEIFSLEGMTLTGTIPGIGVQLRDGDQIPFILKGNEYRGYKLQEVETNRAFFVKNGQEYILHLSYFQDNGSGKGAKNTSSVKKTPSVQKVNNSVAPAEAGKNGTIARELVNDLLMNPFNEMKKVRLRAKFENGDALGIEVQWLARDSLLRELGVKKGDIVKSINSVPIQNMGDISNAINSLMGGDRFEVEVLRRGESVPLTYMVR
jgi:type II secretory pathway component PulC